MLLRVFKIFKVEYRLIFLLISRINKMNLRFYFRSFTRDGYVGLPNVIRRQYKKWEKLCNKSKFVTKNNDNLIKS